MKVHLMLHTSLSYSHGNLLEDILSLISLLKHKLMDGLFLRCVTLFSYFSREDTTICCCSETAKDIFMKTALLLTL